jgi:hypothetical protein
MTGSSAVRTTLLAIATSFGELGIFFLSYSGTSELIGDYAVVSCDGLGDRVVRRQVSRGHLT